MEANLNYQLISAVQFPGCKDLPNKILHDIKLNTPGLMNNGGAGTLLPKNNHTPTKEVKRNLSSSSLSSMSTNVSSASSFNPGSGGVTQGSIPSGAISASSANIPTSGSSMNNQHLHHHHNPTLSKSSTSLADKQRPGLFKQKSNSNQSFLKNAASNLHKRNLSFGAVKQLGGSLLQQQQQNQQNQQQYAPASPQFQPTGGASTPPLPTSTETLNTNDVRIPPTFFPDNSLYTNLPAVLLSSHHVAFNNSFKLRKDLNTKMIPRLEVLLKQVSHKIKEIKTSLKNDAFANAELLKEISKTGQILSRYTAAVETYCGSKPVVKGYLRDYDGAGGGGGDDEEFAALDDPLLVKLDVDSRLKTQLIFENYMIASYVNLQNISKDLFTYLLKELNWVVDKFGKLDFNSEFYQFLKTKISSSSTADWEYFITHNNCFVNTYYATDVNPKRENRTIKLVTLPYANSIQNKCLRFGLMYKKQKLMKNYTRHYYVLSCNYLHEFKFNEEINQQMKKSKDKIGGFIGYEDEPVKSYNLNDYQIAIKDESSFKFTLTKTSNKSKKTFKCATVDDYNSWVEDLSELLKFGNDHYARFAFIERKANQAAAAAGAGTPTTRKSKKHSSNPAGLTLDLGNASNPALSGMFTPKIKTPNESPSHKEEVNPFEGITALPQGQQQQGQPQHQSHYGNKSLSTSPQMTPKGASAGSAAAAGSAAGSAVASPIHATFSATEQQNQHEEYLKLQQALVQQESAISSLKSQEQQNIELIQQKLQNIHDQQVHLEEQEKTQQQQQQRSNSSSSTSSSPSFPGLGVHKPSSDSLNSFIIEPNRVPVAHAAVNGLQSSDVSGGANVPMFSLDDHSARSHQSSNGEANGEANGRSNNNGNTKDTNIPTVFVSQE